jgi:spermidine/putrescine transport system ATP-binding protein
VNTVFQKYALFPHLNVFNNVAFGLKLKKEDPETIKKKVRQALKMANLTGYEERKVDTLSGGQQQRVAIGRALFNHPKLILADEPTGNLDKKSGDEIVNLLKTANEKYHQTIILVTHDLNIAEKAGRIISVEDGKILKEEKHEDSHESDAN